MLGKEAARGVCWRGLDAPLIDATSGLECIKHRSHLSCKSVLAHLAAWPMPIEEESGVGHSGDERALRQQPPPPVQMEEHTQTPRAAAADHHIGGGIEIELLGQGVMEGLENKGTLEVQLCPPDLGDIPSCPTVGAPVARTEKGMIPIIQHGTDLLLSRQHRVKPFCRIFRRDVGSGLRGAAQVALKASPIAAVDSCVAGCPDGRVLGRCQRWIAPAAPLQVYMPLVPRSWVR
mmetsp:Transcript_90683/g.240913  ORF Transcript_90683/g.240913 Transcript_90683/m.240913 type:complete len:233 (+) Transcript_90683:563-1261(+)